jgi:aerobic-type carbon monoxide dehydrogenase small subunit (CoxS/CutS family)
VPEGVELEGRIVGGPVIKEISFKLNGRPVSCPVDTRLTLLDLLRDSFRLKSPKRGCDETVCGACAVLVDGRGICSCTMLAVEVEGSEVVTLEGLGSEEEPNPLQRAFVELDALQCGFCTPGQIIGATSFLLSLGEEEVSEEEVREAMSGNLCRCGCYDNIIKAVIRTAEVVRRGEWKLR